MEEHFVAGKDASLEASIDRMQTELANIGFPRVERSWLNPIDGAWSVHVADRDCPRCFFQRERQQPTRRTRQRPGRVH